MSIEIPTTISRFYVERFNGTEWEATNYGYCGAMYFNTFEEAESNIDAVTKNNGGWDPNGWGSMPHRIIEADFTIAQTTISEKI